MTKDVNLQNRVSEALEFEPGIHAEKIGVTVEDGVITLVGEVPTYAEKFGAVRTAKRVWGVKAIADELDVVLPTAHQRNDSDLAHSALLAIEWDAIVPDNAIKITVTHGRVTLEGSVDWQYQKDAAIRAVRNLTGVKSLINNITVRPRVSPQSVREKIEKAFKRSAELEAAQISVEAREGTVTLRGNVHSLVEREEAERAAWAAPGVSRVEDHLMVVPA